MLVISTAFIVPVLKYLCIHIKFNNIWKILYTRVQFLRLADTMGARITLVLFSSIWHAQSYHTAPIIKYFINIQLCTFFIKYFLNVWYHDKLYAITFLTWPSLISYACMAYRMRLVHIPLRLNCSDFYHQKTIQLTKLKFPEAISNR